MEIGEFHHTDGWYFRRMEDGFVRIRHRTGETVDAEHVIDEASWASIVAHVSARGETGDTFAEARRFHAGEDASQAERVLHAAQQFRESDVLVISHAKNLLRGHSDGMPPEVRQANLDALTDIQNAIASVRRALGAAHA